MTFDQLVKAGVDFEIVIEIAVWPVLLAASVATTNVEYVPTARLGEVVTTPDEEFIETPVMAGERENT